MGENGFSENKICATTKSAAVRGYKAQTHWTGKFWTTAHRGRLPCVKAHLDLTLLLSLRLSGKQQRMFGKNCADRIGFNNVFITERWLNDINGSLFLVKNAAYVALRCETVAAFDAKWEYCLANSSRLINV